jgi:hypothetical protein
VDSLADRLLDTQGAPTARKLRLALEDVNGAKVEGGLRPLGVEKPGIAGR